ncbi:MAG: RdgB/HAM1 family non-canonical purine NTP pyrophosphatase [Flavobacteriales bacterium]|nr:RdgB/HAM1 family non-canonical purine NTP pyrophosphatase [Flavobacteriales bacterium]
MELVFATNNEHKAREVGQILGGKFIIRTLKDIGCNEELEESRETLEGNAAQKAEYVAEKYGVNVFADDTGLEIPSLGGQPGVLSARFAGPGRDSEDNMDKVLELLKGQNDRSAQFRTSICLVVDGKSHFFDGICAGAITSSRAGLEGFGYDPIFQPEGHELTFAEMSKEEKNAISHRGRAIRAMSDWLNEQV